MLSASHHLTDSLKGCDSPIRSYQPTVFEPRPETVGIRSKPEDNGEGGPSTSLLPPTDSARTVTTTFVSVFISSAYLSALPFDDVIVSTPPTSL